MCGGLRINKVAVRPGDSIKYKSLAGERTGIWGLGGGSGAYNARVENLDKVWKKEKENRAVVIVDSFDEKGVKFRRADSKPTELAAIFDVSGDLVLMTMPACGGIEVVHHRQPIVLEDSAAWLQEGDLHNKCDVFEVVSPGPVTQPPNYTDREKQARAFLISTIK